MASDSTDIKVSVQQPRSWSRRMTITIPAQRVQRTRARIAQQLASRVRLPGFRQGKIPQHVLEQQYGPSIEQETLDRSIQDAFREALQSQGLAPINQGKVDNVQYQAGADLTFDVEFEVRPEVRLDRIGGFTATRPQPEVGDDEVAAVLERLRDENAPWHPLPEDATPDFGDQVMVAITPLDPDGEPKPGEKPRTYRFSLGEGKAVQAIEEAITTLKQGEANAFTVQLGEGEGAEADESGEQFLRIELQQAYRKQPPALDDEFARSVGEFDDLAALRERVLADLRQDAEQRAEAEVRGQLLGQVIEANPFEVPDSMVDRYLDYVTGHAEEDDASGKHQHTPEQLEQISQLRTAMRPQAMATLKRMLVVEQIADEHGLRATPDDVDERVEAIAARHQREPREVWLQLEKSGQLESLEREIMEEKVFAMLKSQNTVVG